MRVYFDWLWSSTLGLCVCVCATIHKHFVFCILRNIKMRINYNMEPEIGDRGKNHAEQKKIYINKLSWWLRWRQRQALAVAAKKCRRMSTRIIIIRSSHSYFSSSKFLFPSFHYQHAPHHIYLYSIMRIARYINLTSHIWYRLLCASI